MDTPGMGCTHPAEHSLVERFHAKDSTCMPKTGTGYPTFQRHIWTQLGGYYWEQKIHDVVVQCSCCSLVKYIYYVVLSTFV